MEIFESPAKYVVAACGRRFGKSYLAAVKLIIEGLKSVNDEGKDLVGTDVWYVAPTYGQAKEIMWGLLKRLGADVIEQSYENTTTLKLVNGRCIKLKGSDKPDTLRGVGVSYLVVDEYASMKPGVWETILQPTLADVDGGALFIGTPDGKNHFYDLWLQASTTDEWEAFSFPSTDNPTIPIAKAIERARAANTPEQIIRQEYEASFTAGGSGTFKESELKYYDVAPSEGSIYIAVDPAGYEAVSSIAKASLKRNDETAIAIVRVTQDGWFIEDIQHGRWDIRESSLRIIRAAQQWRAVCVGIEKGALKNAIMPYLEDQMRRLNSYPRIEALTHGGKKKTDRIIWALQGRAQNGRLYIKKAPWNRDFVAQLLDFPNPMAHDDLIDAVAYIDQLSTTVYAADLDLEEYVPLDAEAGY